MRRSYNCHYIMTRHSHPLEVFGPVHGSFQVFLFPFGDLDGTAISQHLRVRARALEQRIHYHVVGPSAHAQSSLRTGKNFWPASTNSPRFEFSRENFPRLRTKQRCRGSLSSLWQQNRIKGEVEKREWIRACGYCSGGFSHSSAPF